MRSPLPSQAAQQMLEILATQARADCGSDEGADWTSVDTAYAALLLRYGADVTADLAQAFLDVWRRAVVNLGHHGVTMLSTTRVTALITVRILQIERTRAHVSTDIDSELTALRAWQDCVEESDRDVVHRARQMGLVGDDLAWGMSQVLRNAVNLLVVCLEVMTGLDEEDVVTTTIAALATLAGHLL